MSWGEHSGTFAVAGINGTLIELFGHKFEVVEGGGGRCGVMTVLFETRGDIFIFANGFP